LLPVSENGPGIGRSHDLKISSIWVFNYDNLCDKFVYGITIYIVITDRSKQTQWCVYSQRESNKISWLYSVFVVYTSFSNIACNIDDFKHIQSLASLWFNS
jgi:hypothetical protein